MINTVGIIGYGSFGKFIYELGKQLFPNIEFRIYSRRAEVDRELYFDLQTVAQSDVVFLCGSISEYEEQLMGVLEYALPQTILVDVATVKKLTSELLRKHADGRRFISTDPLFGPDSFKKYKGDISGFRIVVTDYVLKNNDYQRLKKIFADLGFSIIEMTSDEHDKNLAETLFLTHYVGQSIVKAGFNRGEMDPLSFQFFMDAVESVKGDKKLFRDIYTFNPYCKIVAERLHKAQEEVFSELSS